jgi:hypothetical protein
VHRHHCHQLLLLQLQLDGVMICFEPRLLPWQWCPAAAVYQRQRIGHLDPLQYQLLRQQLLLLVPAADVAAVVVVGLHIDRPTLHPPHPLLLLLLLLVPAAALMPLHVQLAP